MKRFDSIDEIKKAMMKEKYICDDPLAFTLYLSMHMEKPLLHGRGARPEADTPAVL
jgi:hypothetical protein